MLACDRYKQSFDLSLDEKFEKLFHQQTQSNFASLFGFKMSLVPKTKKLIKFTVNIVEYVIKYHKGDI